MSKLHDVYPIYNALLHLYPKQHRQTYGEQMLQTLDDMLQDQTSMSERLGVWLKVGLELPINIIEENAQSMGEISMNKLSKVTAKQLLNVLVALLLVGSYALLAALWLSQRHENQVLTGLIENANQNQRATNGGGYTAVSIVPNENAVYLPLANVKLPATTLNEKLVYSYTPAHKIAGDSKLFAAELDVSTHDLSVNNYSSTQQFDCSEVAYADFVTPSYPTNPMFKLDGKVRLADGRTMNVYYSPSVPGCALAWSQSGVNPKAIADSLTQAVSY